MQTLTLDAALDYALEIEDLDAVADVLDEMDAPSDWDAGSVNFDPYI